MKKYIIIILISFSSIVNAQNMPFSIFQSEADTSTPPPSKVYPTFVSNMFNDSTSLFIPYNIYKNRTEDSIIFYYINQAHLPSPINIVASSPVTDGVTLYGHRSPVATDPVYPPFYPDVGITPMADGKIRSFYHTKDASNQQYQLLLFKSTNGGFTFSLDSSRTGNIDTAYFGSRSVVGNKYTGEDATTFRNPYTDSIQVYFRDSTLGEGFWPGQPDVYPFRTIALSRTTDMLNFTDRQIILPTEFTSKDNPNSINYRKEYYVFTVVTTASDEFWGIANMFQNRSDRRENQSFENDSTYDVFPRLYFSTNGINWVPCNDTLPIIPLGTGIHQLFAIPVIANGKMLIYTMDNDKRHSTADPDDPWRMKLYEILITDLRTWYKP